MSRELPVSEEAERAVLGSIILDSKRVCGLCVDMKVSEASFYSPKHKILFSKLMDMHQADEPIDLLTIGSRLKNDKLLDHIGGYIFLEGVVDGTHTTAHAEYYIGIIKKKQLRREIIEANERSINACYDDERDEEEIIAEASNGLTSLYSGEEEHGLCGHFDESEEIFNNAINGITAGLPTPWDRFTKKTGGIQRGAVCPLLGRDGKGKSLVIAQMLDYWLQCRIPCVAFSLEDVRRRLLLRMGGCREGYSPRTVETGHMIREDHSGMKRVEMVDDYQRQKIIQQMRAYQRKIERAEEENLIFIYDESYTVEEIAEKIKHHARVHGAQGVVIDGFKDITHSKGDGQTAAERHIAQVLFKTAKATGCAIIVVSHVHDVDDGVLLSKRNVTGSKDQHKGARQVIIFQDSGDPAIEDENMFMLSNTKSNFGFGGTVLLQRGENDPAYREV